VGGASVWFASSNRALDFILAACDVEGNFMVVKAYQYTDLLSCMLLNSWALFPRLEPPVLNIALEQMGDSIVPVLLMVVHADQVYLDPARCMWPNYVARFSTDRNHLYHIRVS
jgi:hypothetical protein